MGVVCTVFLAAMLMEYWPSVDQESVNIYRPSGIFLSVKY